MRPARPAFFRVIRFDRSVKGSENAISYVAFRSEDLKGKTPCIFDGQSDHADVRGFMNRLVDPVSRHPSAAKAYHCLFSLRRPDFDALGEPDWREVVREVLRTYELETRRKLDWIASHHPNPDHPHCHVVIKAVYENESGASRRLRLDRQEVQRIKVILGRALEVRGLSPERYAVNRDAPGRQAAHQSLRSFDGVLSWLSGQIEADRRRRAREEEERQRRWLREREQDRDDR